VKKVLIGTCWILTAFTPLFAQATCDLEQGRMIPVHLKVDAVVEDLLYETFYDNGEEIPLVTGGDGELYSIIISAAPNTSWTGSTISYPEGEVVDDNNLCVENISIDDFGRIDFEMYLPNNLNGAFFFPVYTDGTEIAPGIPTTVGTMTDLAVVENCAKIDETVVECIDETFVHKDEYKWFTYNAGGASSGSEQARLAIQGKVKEVMAGLEIYDSESNPVTFDTLVNGYFNADEQPFSLDDIDVTRADAGVFLSKIGAVFAPYNTERNLSGGNDQNIRVVDNVLYKIGPDAKSCFPWSTEAVTYNGENQLDEDNCIVPADYEGPITETRYGIELAGMILDRELFTGTLEEQLTTADNGSTRTFTLTYDNDHVNTFTEFWQNGSMVEKTQGRNPSVIIANADTLIKGYVTDGRNPLRTFEYRYRQANKIDAAIEYVVHWRTDFDAGFYLSNGEIRAMINGNQGTDSYVSELANELWQDSNVQAYFDNVGGVEDWLLARADGVSGNSEFCPDYDPFQFDNDSLGQSGIRIYDGIGCGPVDFDVGPQAMKNIYELVWGVDVTGDPAIDGFMVRYVYRNPSFYGGVPGGVPDLNHHPTWNTQDPNNWK
jgi:hypothetical protein